MSSSITSSEYWDARYKAGYTSGAGSYGPYADFKATFVNHWISVNNIQTVIEWGSGDGNQLSLIKIPEYLGIDVSPTSIQMCRAQYSEDNSKRFLHLPANSPPLAGSFLTADASLSLEVIFHLVEDDVFNSYMKNLFSSAKSHVIIFSSDEEKEQVNHMRERKFTDWITGNAPEWKLTQYIEGPRRPSGTLADFYCYSR